MSTGDPTFPGGPEQVTSAPTPTAPSGDGVQAGAGPERIPLPPISGPGPDAVPEWFRGRVRFLDGVLTLLLLVFAFLIASFKAANADVFLHLASGRQLVGGGPGVTSFVADPVASPTWLFDAAAYLVYTLGPWGGIALVVLKALAVAATAWFVMRAGARPGQSLWVPAVFAFLAVLTAGQRLLLQPTIASMLLLAVTLAILTRATRESRSLWLLPAVCLVWANLDTWFLLGPVTIFLFLLGEVIQSAQRKASGDGPTPAKLALVLLVSLAACLANPNHVFAFTSLPIGVIQSGPLAEFKSDPVYAGYFVSPFEKRYFSAYFGLSATGLSYFVLLGLGLLSFVLTAVAGGPDALRWSRLLIWLAGAGLSAWTYRAIPFFAVVAGPITALNFLDLAARSTGADPFAKPGARRWAVSGRVFTAVVGCAAVLVSLPGWLQPLPHFRRQVGWGVEIDQGLREACLKARSWQERDGGGAARHWHTTTSDAAYYLAWYCPGEKTYVDGRLPLYTHVAREYTALRRSLSGEDALAAREDPESAAPAWRAIFADRGVSFVLFHSSDLARAGLSPLVRMYSNPDEFVPCFVEGSAAIFAYREPGSARPIEPGLAEDFNLLAFGPSPLTAPPEPAPPPPLDWWRPLLQREEATPPGSLTALQHKTRFDSLSYRYQSEVVRGWIAAQLGSLAGMSVGPSGPLGAGVVLPLRMQKTYLYGGDKSPFDNAAREVQQRHLQTVDMGPVASLYLAIRSARQGLRENPDDVVGQRFLGEAYSRLSRNTREFSRTAGLVPTAMMIRQAQIAAALNAVLKSTARPEQQRVAHELLFDAYRDPGYFELRVKHFREYVRLAKQVGPSLPIPAADVPNYFKEMDARLKEMTTELKQRRDQFEVQSANKPVQEKARIAMENGLAETALNLLMRADPKDLRDRNDPREVPGATSILTLLLAMGRVEDVRDTLEAGQDKSEGRGFGTHPLGMPAYEWFQAQLGAATGDYDLADRALADCIEAVKRNQPYSLVLAGLDLAPARFAEKPADAATLAGFVVGNVLLQEATQASGLPWQVLRHVPIRLNPPVRPKEPGPEPALRQASQFLWQAAEQQAGLWAIRAWLALESGRLDKAREYGGQARALAEWVGSGKETLSFPFRSRPLTELVLELAGGGPKAE